MSIRSFVATLVGCALFTSLTHAAEYAIPSGKGVDFFQLDYPAEVPAVMNSAVGLVEANLISLRFNSGIPTGYVNVVRNGEWVVRNMIVPRERDYPYSHLSTEFNLKVTAGTDVSSMTAVVIYSDTVAQTAPAGSTTSTYTVGNRTVNQSGSGDASGGRGAGNSDPPDLTSILFGNSTATSRAIFQLDHPNQEAALNQCYPMAIANSLQFLANTTDLKLPHSHIPGLRGDNSLVGQLDTAMNRTAASRTSGSGVDDIPGVNGKLKYLVQNGLQDRVQTRHWGRFSGNTAGTYTEGGKTSGSTNGGLAIPFDEIVSSLERGENCEAAYSWPAAPGVPSGGHAIDIVAAGYTNGQPWIIESSDLNQGSDSDGAGPKGFRFDLLKDTDNDGDYNLNGSTKELDLLICQKYLPPPTVPTTVTQPPVSATHNLIGVPLVITKTTDPAGHSCCVGNPPATINLIISAGKMSVEGSAPWMPFLLSFNNTSLSGTNVKTVAGFPDVDNSMTGTLSATNLTGKITLGTDGSLPSGAPISWDFSITPPSPWPWLSTTTGKINNGIKPRLRVNGFREITTVKAGEPLAFDLSLDVDTEAGKDADYFLVAKQESTGVMFYFNLQQGNWMPGVQPTFQGKLQNLPNTPLHTRMQGLPAGQYTFTFGVDTTVNGRIDASAMVSDIVTLVVQ